MRLVKEIDNKLGTSNVILVSKKATDKADKDNQNRSRK